MRLSDSHTLRGRFDVFQIGMMWHNTLSAMGSVHDHSFGELSQLVFVSPRDHFSVQSFVDTEGTSLRDACARSASS